MRRNFKTSRINGSFNKFDKYTYLVVLFRLSLLRSRNNRYRYIGMLDIQRILSHAQAKIAFNSRNPYCVLKGQGLCVVSNAMNFGHICGETHWLSERQPFRVCA